MARPVGTKYIETPEKMWQLFENYVKNCKENPRKVNVFGGKDFDKQTNELERPLTLEGFYNYCDSSDVISTLDHYFMNYEGRYADYVGICSRIKRSIRQDQIEGGMVGQYNPSITQRLNNLKEQTESKIEITDITMDLSE